MKYSPYIVAFTVIGMAVMSLTGLTLAANAVVWGLVFKFLSTGGF